MSKKIKFMKFNRNNSILNLTYGKLYEVAVYEYLNSRDGFSIHFTNDSGVKQNIMVENIDEWFIDIKEWRKRKLERILYESK